MNPEWVILSNIFTEGLLLLEKYSGQAEQDEGLLNLIEETGNQISAPAALIVIIWKRRVEE